MKYFLLSLLFLTSCATFSRAPGVYYSDPAFEEYVEEYIDYKYQYLGEGTAYSINLEFGTLEYPTVGRCSYYTDRFMTRTITIDPEDWASYNEDRRFELILHELGHCDMDYRHQEEHRGIMNARGFLGTLTEEHIEHFFLDGH